MRSAKAGLRAVIAQLTGQSQLVPSLAFALQGQELLVASSPAELGSLRSASAGGSVSGGDAYRQAADFSVDNPTVLVYVDAQGAFRMLGGLGAAREPSFQKARTDWAAVKSLLITSGTTSARFHLVVS